jgi:hypothetical protein
MPACKDMSQEIRELQAENERLRVCLTRIGLESEGGSSVRFAELQLIRINEFAYKALNIALKKMC